MEAAGFEPASCEQKTSPMLDRNRSAEKVAAHWLQPCDDSRLLLIAERWAELPEQIKQTLTLLVASTPHQREVVEPECRQSAVDYVMGQVRNDM